MPLYLSRFDNQPKFYWDQPKISLLLGEIRFRQGRLLGRIGMLGSSVKKMVLPDGSGSGYEGKAFPMGQETGIHHVDQLNHHVDQRILTEERLLEWQGGSWRNAVPAGFRAVHASSPQMPVLRSEIRKFLNWFNADSGVDRVLKAAIAYFWFLVISPFDQGNEAIAGLIADIQLRRADGCTGRYYDVHGQLRGLAGFDGSMAAQQDHSLQKTRLGEADITGWLEFYLETMSRALDKVDQGIAVLVKKARFTDRYSGLPLNDRQQLVIQRLLEKDDGEHRVGTSEVGLHRISSSQWAGMAGCSQDTALRDIQDLMDRSILVREQAGGRSTQYILKEGTV